MSLRKPSSGHSRFLSLAGIILAHVPDGIPVLLLSIPGLAIKLCSTLVGSTAVSATSESRGSLRSQKQSVRPVPLGQVWIVQCGEALSVLKMCHNEKLSIFPFCPKKCNIP